MARKKLLHENVRQEQHQQLRSNHFSYAQGRRASWTQPSFGRLVFFLNFGDRD